MKSWSKCSKESYFWPPDKRSTGSMRTFSGLMVHQKGKQLLLSFKKVQTTSYRILLLLHPSWLIPPSLVFLWIIRSRSKITQQSGPKVSWCLWRTDICTQQTKESITNMQSNVLSWKWPLKIKFNSQTSPCLALNIPFMDREMIT